MGLLKLLIEVLDYFSTAIVFTIVCNIAYTMVVDFVISDEEDILKFIYNYQPEFKSLQFYKTVAKFIYNRII